MRLPTLEWLFLGEATIVMPCSDHSSRDTINAGKLLCQCSIFMPLSILAIPLRILAPDDSVDYLDPGIIRHFIEI